MGALSLSRSCTRPAIVPYIYCSPSHISASATLSFISEQSISTPFSATPRLLPPGLHPVPKCFHAVVRLRTVDDITCISPHAFLLRGDHWLFGIYCRNWS